MHNNQQLAFANTIESISHGASFADATMSGMGRGAGNCFMEQMLSFLRNPNYKLTPTLKFVEKYVAEERAKVHSGAMTCLICSQVRSTATLVRLLHS